MAYVLKDIMFMYNDISDAYEISNVDEMRVAYVCVLLMNVLLCMKEFFVWTCDLWFGFNEIYEHSSMLLSFPTMLVAPLSLIYFA